MKPYWVGILGATGSVGQRLIERLEGHPWFRIHRLGASERSAGRLYSEAANWRLSPDPPESVAGTIVAPCTVDAMGDCDLILSGLDKEHGAELEPLFADAGMAVISNSSAYRQHPDVPLLIPEVNANQLDLLVRQSARQPGFIVTNPNCSVTGLALALAPLDRQFGVEAVIVTTFQALSGAGMSGPRALELTDNVLPYIPGEEDKMELELSKLFGRVEKGELVRCPVTVSAHCHRVATFDGHLEAVSVRLKRQASLDEIRNAMIDYSGETADDGLPSSPTPVLVVRSEDDRPQPRLDRDAGAGMAVTVGRLRPCPVLGLKFELLSHNTVRGAAGGTVLNAELLAKRGLLPRRGSA